ncbi:MAG: 30S ribosomal protein S10 [Candidatus Lokiarchaeota archaeon]|nr:30S ribosomal protein S10 [Candidatus Lokiarchaeota archaeon]
MVQKARMRLLSANLSDIEQVCQEVRRVTEQTGVKMAGPIPLPTKHLRIATRKSPCGEGTNTWEHYEMRIHKRLIDVAAKDQSMVLIMKIRIPESVLVEIEII